MVVWNYIIVTLSALLLVFLLWKEMTRPVKLRLWWRIFATVTAVVSLACIAIPVTYTSTQNITAGKKIILLTEGWNKDSLDKLLTTGGNADTFSLDHFSASKLGAAKLVDVLGYGLSNSQLALLNNKPLVFHSSKLPDGIVDASWKRTINQGEKLVVQGTYNNISNKAITLYLSAFDSNVDSVLITPSTKQNFQLQTVPKHSSRAVYSLVAFTGKQVQESNPVPFEVQPSVHLKVLVLSSAPNFENRFLKNWLYQNNYAVVTRTGVSKAKYERSFLNTSAINTDNISASLLAQFDVVISDEDELNRLSKNELGNVKNAVENGLGLIIQADSMLNENAFFSRFFPLMASHTSDKKEVQLYFSGQASSLLQEQPFFIRTQPNTQVLIKDSAANSFSNLALYSKGKIALTTLSNTYSLLLQNRQDDYYQLWSMLLQKTAKQIKEEEQWSVETAMPNIHQQITLHLQTNKTASFGLIGSTKIYLKQNAALPFIWSGTYWPSKAGWHTVSAANGQPFYWYVFNNGHYKSVLATDKIAATKHYATLHPKPYANEATTAFPVKHTIPKIYFFLLFLMAAGWLWFEIKL